MKKFLNKEEVAHMLGLRPAQVYKLAKKGILPSVRLGKKFLFDSEKLEKFLDSGGKSYDETSN